MSEVVELVVKVHSRCNLACAYCYMYEGLDQRWQQRPTRMPDEQVQLLATRIGAHIRATGPSAFSVVIHGGEPLLVGPDWLDHFATTVRTQVPDSCRLRLSIQTNAIGLATPMLRILKRHDIAVGVSLDGDRAANDRYRTYRRGASSYDDVQAGLEALRQPAFAHLFSGVLATIDPDNDPVGVFRAIAALSPPRVDFQFPHRTWADGAPEGTPYADWLLAVFEEWITGDYRLGVRLFDSVIAEAFGLSGSTRVLGRRASQRILTIETDGTIEDADAFKVTPYGATGTGLSLASHSLAEAADEIGRDQRAIGLSSLPTECGGCPVAQVCGGGLDAHRWRDGGFDHRSVYCADLYALITAITQRIRDQLAVES
jgi:uncharacterized protein